ncbi:MAG: hypothetical protein Q4D85_13790, partial [Corynebacterium sp.]|nr:hypothetical protein [Corynebacterium sp.]
DAWFMGVSFAGDAWFYGASFAGEAGFGGVSFAGGTVFNCASFAGITRFTGASFIERLFPEEITFKHTPETRVLLLADTKEGTAFDAAWNLESYNDEWTLEKKTERLKEVYKRFYTALHAHPQKAEKLAGIQKTISENFPGVTLDFKALEAEAEKVLEHSTEYE